MATPLDTALIDAYTRGVNVPVASQAGYTVRADADGTNIDFIGPQITAGSAVWDGKSAQILVGGSGARSVVLKNGYFLGQTVEVVDVEGNAGSGTVSITVSEGALGGNAFLTAAGDARRYMYVKAGQWRLVSSA